ncbi:four helix bundle protein [Aggregatimonas sangjinii]|uniref:Four helix bundle protein n=1 Tax=Aggregatimonas sangjinii TaxID=2583587 RepID=A0A5B7SJM1_9FLAO|nr:four helix bundle protein [Aggregatimonas sangjinii]QCW98654.1 four helix bundle protein [Aggregatimonas sangjinii]
MRDNVIKSKSFDFAVYIVYLYKKLVAEHKEYVMSRQLLKSGTSIGANVREAEFAVSKPDFINKMTISLKEANETDYWLDLLHKTGYLVDETHLNAKHKIEEILKLLVSIVKSSKQ